MYTREIVDYQHASTWTVQWADFYAFTNRKHKWIVFSEIKAGSYYPLYPKSSINIMQSCRKNDIQIFIGIQPCTLLIANETTKVVYFNCKNIIFIFLLAPLNHLATGIINNS